MKHSELDLSQSKTENQLQAKSLQHSAAMYDFTLQSTTPPVSEAHAEILFIVTATRHVGNSADTNLCKQQCAAKKEANAQI